MRQPGIGDVLALAERQQAQLGQVPQTRNAGVRDVGATEPEFPQLAQGVQVRKPGVGDAVAS